MRVSKSGAEKRIEIEFLYLDLDVCTRCKVPRDSRTAHWCSLARAFTTYKKTIQM